MRNDDESAETSIPCPNCNISMKAAAEQNENQAPQNNDRNDRNDYDERSRSRSPKKSVISSKEPVGGLFAVGGLYQKMK